MYVKVKKMAGGGEAIVMISKTATIEELKTKVKERMDIDLPSQRLFFRGKQLENEQTLFDYSINVNDVIQLMIRQPLVETQSNNIPISERLVKEALDNVEKEEEGEEVKKVIVEEASSNYFLVGDAVDVMDNDPDSSTPGAWFEGSVARITKEEGDDTLKGEDGLTYYVKYDAYEGDDYKMKLEHLRPRAKRVLKSRELTEGLEVLVPYNVTEPEKRGEWYSAIVEKARPSLMCTVRAGVDMLPLAECSILFPAEVMALEERVSLGERLEPLDKPSTERKHPEKCEHCHDNDKRKCKECGCGKCGGKEDPELQIVCDECQGAFHLSCIKLASMPEEEEWFCKDCKNEDTTVKAGEKIATGKKKAKMASKIAEENGKKVRDWGQGFATVGRTKVCSKVDKDHFGPIPGVEVGMSWLYRIQIAEEGIHRPHVAGIAGTADKGCPSIVLGGGYEDDEDQGEWFTYTGSGGRDLSGNKRTAAQSFDQELTRTNAAIAINCNAKFNKKDGADAGEAWKKGKPIRVVRGYKGAKHSSYAPKEGNRYDGIYKVKKYWPQRGKSGHIVWRYLLARDDPAPAPWTPEGKQKMEEGGYAEMVKPADHDEYLKAKAQEQEEKLAKKLAEKGEAKAKGKKRKMEDDGGEAETSMKRASGDTVEKLKKGAKGKTVPTASYKIDSDSKALMQEDTANKKLWDDILAGKYLNKKELTDKIEEDFCCMVCMDLVFKPVTTPCGHNICQSCLSRSFKAKEFRCPSCRADLPEDYEKPVNEDLRKALMSLFPGYETGR